MTGLDSGVLLSAAVTAAELCAREPIHIPGTIQPHGALVCVSDCDLKVLHLSANVDAVLSVSLQLGAPLDPAVASVIGNWASSGRTTLQRMIQIGDNRFQLGGHRTAQGLLLEFEPVLAADEQPQDEAYEALRRFMKQIEALADLRAIGQIVAEHIRAISGFNRTLLYRFDPYWNGTVVAEDGDGVLPSYLDMRFPASDIPAQARALYQQNHLRLIPDASYQPVTIDPPLSPIDGRPLDLATISVRGISPVHLCYMRNMGTGASMSISLVRDGRLWGLISCHHKTPRWVSPQIRSACEFLGQLVAQQVVAQERMSEIRQRIALKQIESSLLFNLAKADSFQAGLADQAASWLALTDATGAAVVFAGAVLVAGVTPPVGWIKELAAWLHTGPNHSLFTTDSLAAEWPPAASHAAEASGLIAISISQLHPNYIMWFRQELVHSVTWAGDPNKPTDAAVLSPRKSFDQWKETVRGKSAAWHTTQIESVLEFRNAIIDIVLRRAEERADLTEKLQRSNHELEAFSYSVSHDLRAPFRHIVGYTELLRDRERTLDPTSQRFLDTIRDAALSAGRLVDDLLAFSQLSRASLVMGRIDMNKLFAEARTSALQGIKDRRIDWHIGVLPAAWGDASMVRQAVLNLLSNAVKYTSRCKHAEIQIEGVENDAKTIYTIRDNGIGFDMKYVGKLFGVFQRLHRVEDFEGTGIGLALTKRVIDRHGGWIKAEAVENQGATFSFALPAAP